MSVLDISNDGHVRTLTLNRPEKKNALNDELAWSIVNAIEDAGRDDNVWVLAITGSGGAFCSGLDLTNFGGGSSPLSPQSQQLDDLAWISRFPLGMRYGCEKPIVAGINGVAVGGGLSLAMATDIRIMADNAVIMAGYPRIGGSPDGGLTWTLPQAMGYEKAMRFLLENRTVGAEEALALGLVGEVAPAAMISDRLAEYCAFLCERSPITMRMTKRTLAKATQDVDLESVLRLEIASIGRAFASNDGKEARQAFIEKRPPVFEGR
ncbi:hypothetical protein AYO38_07005 [bacterium SCGC AG-212-C10]|nr:hypothetical protein AYO38_07005 [bacterium SCGC AG-212-C10]